MLLVLLSALLQNPVAHGAVRVSLIRSGASLNRSVVQASCPNDEQTMEYPKGHDSSRNVMQPDWYPAALHAELRSIPGIPTTTGYHPLLYGGAYIAQEQMNPYLTDKKHLVSLAVKKLSPAISKGWQQRELHLIDHTSELGDKMFTSGYCNQPALLFKKNQDERSQILFSDIIDWEEKDFDTETGAVPHGGKFTILDVTGREWKLENDGTAEEYIAMKNAYLKLHRWVTRCKAMWKQKKELAVTHKLTDRDSLWELKNWATELLARFRFTINSKKSYYIARDIVQGAYKKFKVVVDGNVVFKGADYDDPSKFTRTDDEDPSQSLTAFFEGLFSGSPCHSYWENKFAAKPDITQKYVDENIRDRIALDESSFLAALRVASQYPLQSLDAPIQDALFEIEKVKVGSSPFTGEAGGLLRCSDGTLSSGHSSDLRAKTSFFRTSFHVDSASGTIRVKVKRSIALAAKSGSGMPDADVVLKVRYSLQQTIKMDSHQPYWAQSKLVFEDGPKIEFRDQGNSRCLLDQKSQQLFQRMVANLNCVMTRAADGKECLPDDEYFSDTSNEPSDATFFAGMKLK